MLNGVTSILEMRLWLRTIWAAVQAGTYASLQAGLLAESTAKLTQIQGGLLAGTSGNGHSAQFSSPENGVTAEDWANSGSYLLDLYDRSSAILVSSGIASPTDLQIYTEMLFRLANPDSVQFDFTTIRMEGCV